VHKIHKNAVQNWSITHAESSLFVAEFWRPYSIYTLYFRTSTKTGHTWRAEESPCLSAQALFCNDLTFLPSAVTSKFVPLLTNNVRPLIKALIFKDPLNIRYESRTVLCCSSHCDNIAKIQKFFSGVVFHGIPMSIA